jgi:hypothetical protein
VEHQIPGAALFYLTTGGPFRHYRVIIEFTDRASLWNGCRSSAQNIADPERQNRALLIEWQGQGRGLENALSAS